MNNDRRKQISSAIADLAKIKREIDIKASQEETGEAGSHEELADWEENWSSRVDDVRSEVDSAKDDEQEYYDNMPESLQGGDKGQQASDAVDSLQRAVDDLEELVGAEEVGEFTKMFHDKYDDIIGNLEDATA